MRSHVREAKQTQILRASTYLPLLGAVTDPRLSRNEILCKFRGEELVMDPGTQILPSNLVISPNQLLVCFRRMNQPASEAPPSPWPFMAYLEGMWLKCASSLQKGSDVSANRRGGRVFVPQCKARSHSGPNRAANMFQACVQPTSLTDMNRNS